jgi:hypothetical protein
MANSQIDAENKALLAEYDRLSKVSPWLAYPITAVPAIMPFHESTANYRVLAGPNGGGKTTAGAADLASYACGFNPIRKESWPTPNVCWAVCVEYKSAGRVMFRKLAEMLPRKPSGSRNWTYYKQDHIIAIGAPYNSEIHIKSQKEGESSLLGERCTAIWVDEAMGGERGLENFGELQARGLPDQPLKMLFTLTPKMDTGIDWMRRKLWREGDETPHEEFLDGTFCHRFELSDCTTDKGGFILPEIAAAKEKETDPLERDARLRGMWTPFFTRPAFNFGLMLKALERAPDTRFARFVRSSIQKPRLEYVDASPCKVAFERESAHNYIAFWDTASGLGRGHDNSALVVFDRGDLAQVFHARANDIAPDVFAREIAIPASQYYNDAILAIESNGESGATAVQCCRDGYHNLYMQKNFQKANATFTDKFGWNTNEQSRYRMIDALKRVLEEGKWTPTKDLLEEMGHMVIKSVGAKTKVEHADGFHDDLAMAAGGALAVHFEEPLYEWPDFAKLRVRYGPNYTRQEMPFLAPAE